MLENKPVRERLRDFIANRTGDYPIVQTAISIGCIVNSIYTPLRELEDEGLIKRRKTYFTILPEKPQEDLWLEVGKIVMDGYELSNQDETTKKLKSLFSIQRKKATNLC